MVIKMEELIKKLKKMDIGKVLVEVPLKDYTTYKVGGTAKCFVYPKSIEALIRVLKLVKSEKVKYMVLGNEIGRAHV